MRTNNRTNCLLRGFTLLELIVAIALMDIIAVTLYSSMYTGFRAKKKSQAILKPFQSIIPAFEFIRKDLTSAARPDGILAGVFSGENVSGQKSQDADTLSFYTCSYQPETDEVSSNIVHIEYVLKNDTQRNQIVLKRLITKNILSPTEADPEEEVICRGIAGLDMKYYDGSSWVDEWDSSEQDNQLPWGVQVTLTIDDSDSDESSDAEFRNFTRIYLLPTANEETTDQDQENTQ